MIIQLIAPSGYPADPVVVKKGIAFLEQQGHTVRGGEVTTRRYQRFAGSEEDRLADINGIADLPNDVDAVMAVRGGYGVSRLLPKIDFNRLVSRIRSTQIQLIGHSDFSVLQLALLQHGITSYSGPMLCADFGHDNPNPAMLESFFAAINGKALDYAFASDFDSDIQLEGVVWGGNLSVIMSLLGTPYFPKIEQGILLIEDVNEHPYRIERMLLQLHYAGVLSRQKALILGDFSNYRLTAYDQDYDVLAMRRYIQDILPIPVVSGFPFGHIANKLTVPLGRAAHLNVKHQYAVLSFTKHSSAISS